MSKTRLAVAGGILVLAAVTALAGYPASAAVIVGCALLRVAVGIVLDHRAQAVALRAAPPDPLGDDVGTFSRTLRDDVVGVEDFLAAADARDAPRRPRR